MNKKIILKKLKYSFRFLPDSIYIQIYYFIHFKHFCNLKNPKTFNEKVNWLKFNDRNPNYIKMVDKYEVKSYVKDKIGEEYIVPLLGLWKRFDDIDFDKLPNQFVLKCTHDSAGLVIVRDKSKLNMDEARKKIQDALKYNYYYLGREWPYKYVEPRIIAEAYLEDHEDGGLRDYKFFCFNGVPKILLVISGRSTGNAKLAFYDMNFNQLDIKQYYPQETKTLEKPRTFNKMIEFSKVLSKDLPHVRVDFYEADGRLYFGELTLHHYGGLMPFLPDKWDWTLGEWLKLPQ